MSIAVIRVGMRIGKELKEGTFVPEVIPGGDGAPTELTTRQLVSRFVGDPYTLEVLPAHDFAGYNVIVSMKE